MAISEKLTKINEEVSAQADLLEQVLSNLEGKGGSSSGIDTSDATAKAYHILAAETAYVNGVKITGTLEKQEKTVAPTTTPVTVTPDDGNLLSKVTVAAIPTETWVFTLENGSTVNKEVEVVS